MSKKEQKVAFMWENCICDVINVKCVVKMLRFYIKKSTNSAKEKTQNFWTDFIKSNSTATLQNVWAYYMLSLGGQDLLTSAALVIGTGWGKVGVSNYAALAEVGKSFALFFAVYKNDVTNAASLLKNPKFSSAL
jgi:hypothetical protein